MSRIALVQPQHVRPEPLGTERLRRIRERIEQHLRRDSLDLHLADFVPSPRLGTPAEVRASEQVRKRYLGERHA